MTTPTIDDLNRLTDAGVISDNAINWNDVCPHDQQKALRWLELQKAIKEMEHSTKGPK